MPDMGVVMRSLLFLTAAALLLVCQAWAAPDAGTASPSYIVKSWQTMDGLPQNSVASLAQTPDGYLWVGTRGGLARFDGVRFRTYGLADGLRGLSIRALLDDGQGGLWIATRGGGLSRWRDGVISTLTPADGLAHEDVLALAPAEPGAVWIGTGRGLQHWGPDGFKQVGEAEGVRGPVFGMAVSPTEGLWFNLEGVGLFHCQGGRCEFVEPVPKSRGLFPSSFLVDAEGSLWIGMGNGVVLRRQAGAWKEFNEADGVPFSYIYCMARGPSGEIWAGSHEAGLYVFRGGRFHAVPGTDGGIRSLTMVRDGVLWVGTLTGGLSRLTRPRVTSFPVGAETRRGQINGMVEDPPSQFWVTTFGGGLFRGSMDRLEPVRSAADLTDNPFLSAGLRMRDGTVFFAGQKRLWRKAAGTGEIRGTVLTDNPRALCEDADGSLWLGTFEGELKRLVDDAPQAVPNGMFAAPVTGMVRKGPVLWVATQGAGLYRWEAGQMQRWTTAEGLPTGILLSLYQDADGTLWIGTAGGGLAWLEGGRVQAVNTRQGLGDDVISQILADDLGNLWLGCNRGISRVSKRELRAVAAGQATTVHPLVLDESDGMLTAECTGGYSPAGLRSQSGMLYFSTVRGIVEVDPAQFGPSANPPGVLIEEVKLDGKSVTTRGGVLSVPAGSGELEIQFTAFNFAKPGQLRFRHRLGGGDHAWVEVEGARSVRYSQLPPGDYEFAVTAANPDLQWQENAARLAFTVQPLYWQTTWFRTAGVLTLLALGGGLTWWLMRSRHARMAEKLELQEQRNEIAHLSRVTTLGEISGSLAHELNQPLGAILANTEAAELHLQNEHPDLEELREILADIRKDDMRAGEIIHGMRAFLRRRELEMRPLPVDQLIAETVKMIASDAATRNITIGLHIEPGLPSVTGDHIHLQQVLLNLMVNGMDAMNHIPLADRHLTIRATRHDDDAIEIAVTDAGTGIPAGDLLDIFKPFHTSKRGGLGLGLAICRSIMEAHGGSISLSNNPERGATARFSLRVAGGGGGLSVISDQCARRGGITDN